MNDVNFDCDKCGQNLDAPAELAGWEINCPACEALIKVPGDAALPEPAPSDDDNTFAKPAQTDFSKSSTVRIDLPSDYGLPQRKQRIIKIKRPGQ